ncbi:sulfatase-like hydrolase/transferase [Algisphaera agarilytica]|uniref:Arylsulfatase n=1 Tax=Algisphaera agarilytica TaxID=1385975 RepID=A0A7X0H3G4_9BACT|nr:sulfatase-like hydrolase/transferase [Algisphaera agarilytica]MBB6428577.1 arylsulfatase [Algisphaera agarilytica]
MFKALLLVCLMVLAGSVRADDRPNIVVIMTDDAGYSDLGSFGGEIDTPHLDRLAEQGIRLSNFYSNGRCSPTRATLLTGLDCARVGFGGGVVGDWGREMPYPAHRGRLPYNTPLLSELLKDAGYRTLMSGKWHLGGSTMKVDTKQQEVWKRYHPGWELTKEEIELDWLALPLQRGFDEYFGLYGAQDSLFFVPGQPHPMREGNKPAKLTYDRVYTMHCFSKWQQRYNVNHGKTGKAFYATDGVTDRAIEMIEDAAGDDAPPFFLYVAHRAPHKPLQAPEELVQKYLKKYADIRAVEATRHKGVQTQGLYAKHLDYKPAWINPGKEDEFRLQMALHAAMMEKVDEGVGRLMDTLEQTGELDNTLVLYFSDNGNASHLDNIFNTPYRGMKALLWEGGTKTHFIASWPNRIEPGSMSHEQVWVGDILPMCLELAGVEYPETFRGQPTETLPGRNMLSVLQGQPRPPAEAIFFNDKGQQSVIYQGRWKLLIEPGWYTQTLNRPGIAYELYDLDQDPAELNNLAEAKPKLVQKLAKMCEDWKQDMGIVEYGELLELRPGDNK